MPVPSLPLSIFVLSLALLVPILLTVWARRRALSSALSDRAALWFSCVRFIRFLIIGTLVFWWILLDLLSFKLQIRLLLLAHGIKHPSEVALLFAIWLAPMLVVVFCQVLFQPVYTEVRSADWSRKEIAVLAALGLANSLVPILLIVSGFLYQEAEDSGRNFVLCYMAAAAIWIASAYLIRQKREFIPSAVTSGELRDRAFSLAAEAKVRLGQLYIVPAGKARQANAFAHSANNIIITDYLLNELTKREVDAVIGHELTHLKKSHPRWLGLSFTLSLGAIVAVWVFPSWPLYLNPLFDLLFVAVPLLTFYFVSRRFEFIADAGSVKLTGDGEALITGLAKLHQLNQMPLSWGKWNERLLTHPSTVRRARAIARVASMPKSRIAEILQSFSAPQSFSDVGDSQHYAIPPSAIGAAKVFSTQFKRKVTRPARFFGVFITAFQPALLFFCISKFFPATSDFAAATVVLVLTLSASFALSNWGPFLAYPRLRRKLSEKFAEQGISFEKWNGRLTGFSPGDRPRVFEGNYSWDIGGLFFFNERFCYWGEETTFSVRRDQILCWEVRRTIPSWIAGKSLFLTWRADDFSEPATFNIRPADVSSILQMNREVHSLAQQLARWKSAPGQYAEAPQILACLPSPHLGEVTGPSIRELGKFRVFFNSLILTILFSCISVWLLGSDFDSYPRGGFLPVLYAPAISTLVLFFAQLPVWLFRNLFLNPQNNSLLSSATGTWLQSM